MYAPFPDWNMMTEIVLHSSVAMVTLKYTNAFVLAVPKHIPLKMSVIIKMAYNFVLLL